MAFGDNAIKRTTLLSLMDKAIAVGEAETVSEALAVGVEVLAEFDELGIMEDDGDSGNSRSGGRKGGSAKRGSSSRSGKRSSGGRKGGGKDNWRKDPATDAQIDKAIELGALEEGYEESQLEDMTKGELSDIIEELNE